MQALEMIYNTPAGKFLAKKMGLTEPPRLRRGRTLPTGPIVLAELDGGGLAREALSLLGITPGQPLLDVAANRTKDDKGRDQPPRYQQKPGAVVVDATGVREITQLEEIRQVLRPAMRGLEPSGRIIILATDAADVEGLEAKAVAQGIDGINRTVGKELRAGATSNLVFVRAGAGAADVASTMSFLLEGRSAFVSGQAWRVGPAKVPHEVSSRPFEGRVVVVTGAARGIGAAIARTFARDGAEVVAVDIPAAGDALAKVANEIKGSALQLDITAPDAGERIASHVASRPSIHSLVPREHSGHETDRVPSVRDSRALSVSEERGNVSKGANVSRDPRIWAIVHNAGITRDRMLANLDEKLWGSVLDVNLAAEIRINDYLLNNDVPGGFADEARIVGIASTSGVAGNKGQTNYAASKAGVMGLVWAMRDELADRPITTNAVAPGFIETEMTAAIPFVQREIFRRTNSLSQGGNPVDVAETLAYLCEPASGGVDGQVIRVCGQNLVGA